MNIGMHPDFDGLFYNRKESESAFKIAEAQFASFKYTITSNITGLSFELKVLPGKALLRATLRSTSFYFVLLRSPQISSDLLRSRSFANFVQHFKDLVDHLPSLSSFNSEPDVMPT